MTASVIIPTLDPDGDMAKQCVASIGDDVDVHLVHDKDRDGFAATCTRGANEAPGDVLVFLNDDTVVSPGWLEALEIALEAPGADRIVGARLCYPDGRIQHSGVFFRRRGGALEAFNRRVDAPAGEVPAVTGACLALKRSTWDALGGFDGAYVNGYEDVDLALRHRETGGICWYEPACTVVHFESQSPGRFDHAQENVALLQQRWGHLPI